MGKTKANKQFENKYLEVIRRKAFLSTDQLHPRVRDGQVLQINLKTSLSKFLFNRNIYHSFTSWSLLATG